MIKKPVKVEAKNLWVCTSKRNELIKEVKRVVLLVTEDQDYLVKYVNDDDAPLNVDITVIVTPRSKT